LPNCTGLLAGKSAISLARPDSRQALPASEAVAWIKRLVLDDEVRDWKVEAIEGGFRTSLLEPAGVLVSECDDDQFIRREGPSASSIAFRVGITNPQLNVVARCRFRKLVGPLGCVGAGVVVGVCQPVEPGDVGGWRDDERLCILACVRADRRAQSGRGGGGGGDLLMYSDSATRRPAALAS
jgi:hypothetical protein